jgi:hypothetical protein
MSLWLSADKVPPGPVELVAVFVNHTGVAAIYGVDAKVDRWDGVSWVPHGQLGMCVDHWHCTGEVEPLGENAGGNAIGLTASLDSPGPVERFTTDGLEVGWYRISQMSTEGTATGVMEVAEGAPAPAPLPPLDAPAISVHPALVPTEGGRTILYPLVPSPTGFLSIGDVEQAVEGLSETARVERWVGAQWTSVTEVELQPLGPDMPDARLGRSVELPSLPEGEYRLVRTGPGHPHTGGFWVEG